jgi:threonine synthase
MTGLHVHLKYEGLNPTGSFKDRGMTVAVSKALEEGATAAVCASTGNTSASAAAYCGRAGIRLAVVLPEGAIARGKLAQAQICGARVVAIQGDFDDALRLVRELVERHPVALLNSVNPHRLEGQKTAAFEVLEQLGFAPDWLALPVGNGGNITAYWKGFREMGAAPRLLAGQAAGAAPLVSRAPVRSPQTVATAIRIGNPARLGEALAALDQSGGAVRAIDDEGILAAYRLLAQEEGVFCEPASAASVAALLAARRDGVVEEGSTVVCVLTGHGLKDPDTAGQQGAEIVRCPPDVQHLEQVALLEPAHA